MLMWFIHFFIEGFLSLLTTKINKITKCPNVLCAHTQCFIFALHGFGKQKDCLSLTPPPLASPLSLTNHNIVGKYVLLSVILVDVFPFLKIKINKWNSLYFSQKAKIKTKNLNQDVSFAWIETDFFFVNQEIRNILHFYLNQVTIKPCQ